MRRLERALFLVAAVLFVRSGYPQHVVPEQAVDQTKYPPDGTRWSAVGVGLGTTAGFYAVAQPFSYAWPDSPGLDRLRLPLVGPWLALADNSCDRTDSSCSEPWMWFRGALMVLDGLGQLGGLGIALDGYFLPQGPKAVEKNPGAPGRDGTYERLFVAPRPMGVAGDGLGLSMSGAF